MAGILLKNVKKRFENGFVAVERLNLEIYDKEFLVLVGPSGCAKSTTLRMVAGLEEITEGELYIGDTRVNDTPPKDRNIAMVFQDYALYPHMNVYNNIAFGLKMRKIPEAEIDRLVREAAEILGIDDLLKRKPRQLSGGQRQRVALGRAIVRKPQVFLFDEPLSNLDAKLRVQMRTELKKLHEKLQTTIIYVTHDQVEAMTMGTRIVVMKEGAIHQVGAPLDLYDHPANRFVAGFIGSPSMNFVPCLLREDKGRVLVDTRDFLLELGETQAALIRERGLGAYTLGVRSEDIHPRGGASGDLPTQPFTATVNVTEPLGKETFLELDSGIHNLFAVFSRERAVKARDRLELELDMGKIHLFETGGQERAVF